MPTALANLILKALRREAKDHPEASAPERASHKVVFYRVFRLEIIRRRRVFRVCRFRLFLHARRCCRFSRSSLYKDPIRVALIQEEAPAEATVGLAGWVWLRSPKLLKQKTQGETAAPTIRGVGGTFPFPSGMRSPGSLRIVQGLRTNPPHRISQTSGRCSSMIRL